MSSGNLYRDSIGTIWYEEPTWTSFKERTIEQANLTELMRYYDSNDGLIISEEQIPFVRLKQVTSDNNTPPSIQIIERSHTITNSDTNSESQVVGTRVYHLNDGKWVFGKPETDFKPQAKLSIFIASIICKLKWYSASTCSLFRYYLSRWYTIKK